MIRGYRLLITIILSTIAFSTVLRVPEVQASYPSIFGDSTREWITKVNFGNINNTTGQENGGYGDYTYGTAGILTMLTPGVIYPLSVTIQPDKWCGEYVTAYIDWNRNGHFTDSGENTTLATNTCAKGPHTVNIKVPAGATPGETRMRVIVKYDGHPSSYGNIPEGEAEDYTIVIDYPNISGDTRLEWITNVTFGDIDNSTIDEPNGYGDYIYWKSGMITEVARGGAYPISVTINPYTTSCGDNVSAFFDWNHDGDFNDLSEKVVLVTDTCDPGPHPVGPNPVMVKVPSYASHGTTRMRVVLNYYFTPQSTGHTSGEAEDYTVNVVGGGFPIALYLPAIIKKTK